MQFLVLVASLVSAVSAATFAPKILFPSAGTLLYHTGGYYVNWDFSGAANQTSDLILKNGASGIEYSLAKKVDLTWGGTFVTISADYPTGDNYKVFFTGSPAANQSAAFRIGDV
ncbi:hypothetical protein BKA62DRAFT_825422 [Auriculariales sp. MPI-PUGE-AT-0066]|nr:hypothetical protein BKA62DRAFT_825422 [Auriculariales sp. MPI-PUGE-AT-0066]